MPQKQEDQSRPTQLPALIPVSEVRIFHPAVPSEPRDFENVGCPECWERFVPGEGRSIVSSALAEGLCKRKSGLGPRWPWSCFQFGTTRQKRRYGVFLFVLSEQDNREVQRLDLPAHVLHLYLFSTQTCKYSLRII